MVVVALAAVLKEGTLIFAISGYFTRLGVIALPAPRKALMLRFFMHGTVASMNHSSVQPPARSALSSSFFGSVPFFSPIVLNVAAPSARSSRGGRGVLFLCWQPGSWSVFPRSTSRRLVVLQVLR